MLIQNIGNVAQATQSARSDGSTNVGTAPAATVALPQAAPKSAVERQASAAELKNAVDGINRTFKQSNRNLEFSVDADTSKSVVKVVDTETGDTIRQFPSKEALAIFSAIDQIQQGLLLKQKA